MLKRTYDPMLPYRLIKYGRMSDPKQNQRSPEQQFKTFDETQQRFGYPWSCVATYRDDFISGQYLRKRPSFQRMLRDIELKLVEADLIGVDTMERLGRAEEIPEIRRKLFIDYGMLVVAADNDFADPTGVVGKALGMVEQMRSTENTRVSAHNVLRGKKDAARRRRWPGGPPPFGYKLKPVVDESVSPPEMYNELEVEPRGAAAQKLAFERAAETGEGSTRLARWWNTNPEIPDEFKPISAYTMAYRLKSRIYVGDLVWGANQTGIVNDTRVVEPNPDGAVVIPDFCDPLVTNDVFNAVNELKKARSLAMQLARQKVGDEEPPKLIAPQSRGLVLHYILTGLVRCGCCKASMRPVTSGRTSKAGKTYTYYTCPRHLDGACENDWNVPEDRLREAVVARLRARLFPLPDQSERAPDWLPTLVQLVQLELDRYRHAEPDRAALRESEMKGLNTQLAGWTMTLGDPALPAVVRGDIVAQYEKAKLRKEELEQRAASEAALKSHMERTLDPRAVIKALGNLHEVLAAHNPTLVNLELSKHIDKIECNPDGRVELRGTCLGLFEGAVELLSRNELAPEENSSARNSFEPVKPRRRGQLRIPNLSAESQSVVGNVDTALDPERFAGVPEQFFWKDTFMIKDKMCWAQEHALEVARKRAAGMNFDALAAHFGVTRPTIRSALRHAVEADSSLAALLPKKVSHGRWAVQHAAEVAELKAKGMSTMDIAKHFDMSDTTIRTAMEYAKTLSDPLGGAGGQDTAGGE